MCGIVGFTGKRQAAPVLLDGLRVIELVITGAAGGAMTQL